MDGEGMGSQGWILSLAIEGKQERMTARWENRYEEDKCVCSKQRGW